MAGVYHFLVYIQTAQRRPSGDVYANLAIVGQVAYTARNGVHQPFLIVLGLRWVVVYI